MDDYLNLRFRAGIESSAAQYVCLQRLGTGGSAETYLMLAQSGRLRGQQFAVKVFRRLSKPHWREHFLQEAKFLQSCDHPAVMRVFDEGVYLQDHPFVVAEYLPFTLASMLRTSPPMIAKMAYALQTISALEYLSRPEIAVVHRDIKPANLFIKGGSCVLGDFGLMKRPESGDDDREMLVASIGPRMPRYYRTPDLVDYFRGGPPPTCKSDVYQLGLVLAEMFSGGNPQKPMVGGDYKSRVELDSFYIPGGMGSPIKDLLMRMLVEAPDDRPTAERIIPDWQDLFLEAARRSIGLEGRVV